MSDARSSLGKAEAELALFQGGIESEAEALRKLKMVPPEKRSVLAESEIRSRSRKARELAERERAASLRARAAREKVGEYAATLELLVADLVDGLIGKMERDLSKHGTVLHADRESFADWALQHRRYQELYLGQVPASADWQERLPQNLGSGELGMELLVQGWRDIVERRLFRLRDKRAVVANEEKIRSKMDQLLRAGAGRFELGPAPEAEEGGEAKTRTLREIQKELDFLDREILNLERNLVALRHLQAGPDPAVK